MKRHPLLLFFLMAFFFPWLVWGTGIAQAHGLFSFHILQPLAFWIGLNLATYIAAAYTGGRPAVKDILLRLIRWRVSPAWYLTALILTGLLAAAAIGIDRILGGAVWTGADFSLANLAPALLFQIFFFWLTEESAWRGFALPRLQARYSNLTASLILGMLWGLWHLPLVFIPGSFQSTVPFSGFLISALATSVLITWIFNSSRGSLIIAAIFHAATDVAIGFTNVMTAGSRLFWIFVGIQVAAAVILVLTQGTAHLSRARDQHETVYPAAG